MDRQPRGDKLLMSTERPYHFTHFLQVSKKSLWTLIYTYFFMLLYMYMYTAPGSGRQPLGTKFLCQQKHLVTSVICCKFLPLNDFLTFFLKKCIFSHIKSIRKQIWPCRKIGQGQPRVIIEQLGSTRAPNAAYQVSRSSAFLFQRRFFKVFTIHGHGGHLGHVTWTVWTNFRSPVPRRLHMKFGFNRPSGFRGDDVWKCWQHTNVKAYLYYKLIHEPKGSGELNMYLYMSHIVRKPVLPLCKQQRRRSACASAQSDQRLCCSLPR